MTNILVEINFSKMNENPFNITAKLLLDSESEYDSGSDSDYVDDNNSACSFKQKNCNSTKELLKDQLNILNRYKRNIDQTSHIKEKDVIQHSSKKRRLNSDKDEKTFKIEFILDETDIDDNVFIKPDVETDTESDEESDSAYEFETSSNISDNSTSSTNTIKSKSSTFKKQEKIDFSKINIDTLKKEISELKWVIDEMNKTKNKSILINEFKEQLKNKSQLLKDYEQYKKKQNHLDNITEFTSLLSSSSYDDCDITYFTNNLNVEKQKQILENLKEIQNHIMIEKPYKIALLEYDIPTQYKAVAYKKINMLSTIEPGNGEYYKIKQWVDSFMQIPFNKYKHLPVSIKTHTHDECNEFMKNSIDILNKSVYGMDDAKMQIMQLVGKWISNPDAMGTALAIKGPMGTGKTTLVKDGISKILKRDFAFIALGGATDSSYLEGHSYTYEGSTWGKILDILIQCKSMNPVIFLDELDKVSDTPKGEEIIGILTHLTDTTQNSKFHDKYFSELDFDLSKALFIFSYNDESKVNPILRDRMYTVETKGYNISDKTAILNKYMIPSICSQINFQNSEVIFNKEVLKYIIENYTANEKGVRNLKRCIETIYSKLNLYKLMRESYSLLDSKADLNITFPLTLTNTIVDKLLKNKTNNDSSHWKHMYV